MNAIALVTGGARRLGKALALCLARIGFDILLHYHQSESQALETVQEIGKLGVRAYEVKADLTKTSGIETLLTTLDSLTEQAPFTLLVNSASIMLHRAALELDLTEWQSALALNLRAPFLLSQHAARRMPTGGMIVNMTDVGARKTWKRYPSYVITKAALESMTSMLARALAPAIRVNAIAPGLVLRSSLTTEEEWTALTAKQPLKRPAELNEITSALEFLIMNKYITGQTITVDGGYSLL